MNALTLVGLLLASILAVQCSPPNHHQRQQHQQQQRTAHHQKHLQAEVAKTLASMKDNHQTLQVEHVRVPEKVRARLMKSSNGHAEPKHLKPTKRAQEFLKSHENKGVFKMVRDSNSTGTQSGTAQLEDYNDWFLIANITIGTPPQQVRVIIDQWEADLYVVGANANVDCPSYYYDYDSDSSSDSTGSSGLSSSTSSDSCESWIDYWSFSSSTSEEEDETKQGYNSSASSTAVQTGKSFQEDWGYTSGLLVTDVVGIGGANVNVTLGDADEYAWFYDWFPIDGVLGLAPFKSDNHIPNVLKQIVGQLAEPVIVLNTRRDFGDWVESDEDPSDDPTEVNQLTVGTTNAPGCNASTFQWHKMANTHSNDVGSVTLHSVSVPSVQNDCLPSTSPNSSHPVYVTDFFYPLLTSFQVLEQLLAASGATYSDDDYAYIVPDVSSAQNVQLNLRGETTIQLTPQDYTVQYAGTTYLWAFAYYDDNFGFYSEEPLILGQNFANNHCIGYNINDNTLGVADRSSSS